MTDTDLRAARVIAEAVAVEREAIAVMLETDCYKRLPNSDPKFTYYCKHNYEVGDMCPECAAAAVRARVS